MVGPETNTLLGEPSSGVGAQNTQFTIKKKKKFVSSCRIVSVWLYDNILLHLMPAVLIKTQISPNPGQSYPELDGRT